MVGFMGVFSMIGCRALKNLASLPCGLPFLFKCKMKNVKCKMKNEIAPPPR
jgi:hypothetical protein